MKAALPDPVWNSIIIVEPGDNVTLNCSTSHKQDLQTK